jgi:hypothetical protein
VGIGKDIVGKPPTDVIFLHNAFVLAQEITRQRQLFFIKAMIAAFLNIIWQHNQEHLPFLRGKILSDHECL